MKSTSISPAKRFELHPTDFGPHWNTNYYEILHDYYWEPQHLGRGAVINTRIANQQQMLGSIRRMEVSLNHVLALFFSLAPQTFIEHLEEAAFGNCSRDTYRSVGIFELRRSAPHDPTQPDVFLVSGDSCFSMEMKIGAKSCLEQVVKYALLHGDYQKRTGATLRSRLLYLTPRPVSKTWVEKFPDLTCMRSALEAYDYPALLKKANMEHALSVEELRQAVLTLEVAHFSFADFYGKVMAYAAAIPAGAYTDTARKLFDGLIHELESRRDMLRLGGRC